MALTNGYSRPFKTFELGLDTDSPIGSDQVNGTLSEAMNCIIAENDLVTTRPGFLAITNIINGFVVREAVSYVDGTGTRMEVLFLEAQTPTGFTGRLYKYVIATGAVTLLAGALPDGQKPSMVQAGTSLYIFATGFNYKFNGTALSQIGITEPVNAPTDNANIVGGMDVASTVLYCYTYYNSTTGAESSPSPVSALITIGAGGGRRINLTAGSAATADKIVIYRTMNGTGTFYYDDEVAIASITFDSVHTDYELGQELEWDNSRLPENASIAVVQDNRIFVAGFASNPCRVQYSKIGINGPMYESFQAADFCDCNNTDGDSNVGLGTMNSQVGVIKSRSCGTLLAIDAGVAGLERFGSQKYIYNEISREISSVSHHTIISTRGTMLWLGKNNIYMSNGSTVLPVANRIKSIIRSLEFTESYKFSVVNDYDLQQIMISVVQDGKSEPDYQIVGRYVNYPTMAFVIYGPGPDTATHPGIPASCMWHSVVAGVDEIIIGSSVSTGSLYTWNSGTNDNGFPIHFSCKTPWEIGTDGTKMKSFQSVQILAVTSAQSPNNYITHTWEEDGSKQTLKTGTTTLNTIVKWGTKVWGTFLWSGIRYTVCKFFPNRKAYLGRYGFHHDKIDSPIWVKSVRMVIRQLLE